MTIGARITNTGILFTAGSFDEVTQGNISITANNIFAGGLDEVTKPGVAMRYVKGSRGTIQVNGYFDEITGLNTDPTPILSGFSLSSSTVTYGASAPTITAPTSPSPGAITYTSSNTSVATVSGNVIVDVGLGTTTITATQAATANYTSANATANLTITIATPQLNGFALSSTTVPYGTSPTIIAPTSVSSGAITYKSSNISVANVSGTTITDVGTGTANIMATQVAYGPYTSATANVSLTITTATPVLTGFGLSTSSITYGASAPTITVPTSPSSGAIGYLSSNTSVASIDLNSGVISVVSSGNVTFTAFQLAYGFYNAAASVTANLTVNSNVVTSGVYEQVSSTKFILPSGITQSTAIVKYGTSSISFAGTNVLEYYYPSGFQSSSTSVLIEAWAYPLSSTTYAEIMLLSSSANGNGQALELGITGTGTALFDGTDTTGNYVNQGNGTGTANAWNHIALWASPTNWSAYLNGSVIVANQPWPNAGGYNYQQIITKSYFDIGGWARFSHFWQGYMDDIRISSINRYNNTSYTVPSSRLTVDGSTLALIQSL